MPRHKQGKNPAGTTRMLLTAKEAQVIKSMRYDDEKMLEGWNLAIDAVIKLLTDEPEAQTYNEVVSKIAEMKR